MNKPKLEQTFASAFENGAKKFVQWGSACFVSVFVYSCLQIWRVVEVYQHGYVPAETQHILNILIMPSFVAIGVTLGVSAYVFLARIYRARQFLEQEGGLRFPNWFETVISFVFPIANFFVPWNRIDAIRELLRTYAETGQFQTGAVPEKKLRTFGYIWGALSLISIKGGTIESVSMMMVVLTINSVFFIVYFWTFYQSTRWLSELMRDLAAAEAKREQS